MEGYQWGGGDGGKGTENKWSVQNRQGEVKNSVGNGGTKQLICTTHGHELRGWECQSEGWYKTEGIKGTKKLYNYNSIINKIYFLRFKNM